MASVNVRPTRDRRDVAGRPVLDPDRLVTFGPDSPVADDTRPTEGDVAAGLRDHVAKLEASRRHLQKDIVVKDAYLAALRADLREKEREVASLRETLDGLHEHIAQTLSQPRYRAVDAINRVLHHVAPLHRFLKRRLVKGRSTERFSGDRLQQQ